MFASLRLPRHFFRMYEVMFHVVHSSLVGIGLMVALLFLGVLNLSSHVNTDAAWDNIVAQFRVDPAPVVVPEEVDPAPLDQPMEAAADFIARRYRVAKPAIADIVRTAETSARTAGLDPLLVLAVIGIESRYNPLSESVVGAQGLMQIIGKYHTDKFAPTPDGQALLDPEINVRVGVSIIKEYLQRTGNLDSALQMYAGAADDSEFGYSGKVMAEKRRLEVAVRQKVKA